MQIIRTHEQIPEAAKNSVIALGNFDGMHKGHALVINKAKDISRKLNCPLALMTFEPHPNKILGNKDPNFRLTILEKKAELADNLGVDFLFVTDFNYDFAAISPENFIKTFLVGKLKVKHIVVGDNFTFGHKRKGNTDLLKDLSVEYSYDSTEIITKNNQSSEIIYSSTLVRNSLRSGNIKLANDILGRNFSYKGKIIKGNNLGEKLGFRTINLEIPEDMIIPCLGVYAVEANISGDLYNGVANIGKRPTIALNEIIIEIHLFNFDQMVYEQYIEVYLVDFIRKEKKFLSIEDLQEQIGKDCITAKDILGI